MYAYSGPIFCVVLVGLLVGGCADAPGDPAQGEVTYGRAVDAIQAIPAPAVVAEGSRYAGGSVTVDGHIVDVRERGCALALDTGGARPLVVDALRDDENACAWRAPEDIDGVAVATGTLRVVGDTLRLAANGVRVTPVRSPAPDSDS